VNSTHKSVIRRVILSNRKLISETQIDERSLAIANNVATAIKNKADIISIHTFLPISRNKEINTWKIIDALGQHYKFVVSKTDFETREMTHFRISDSLELEEDKYGIPSPVKGDLATLQEIDAVLIPLLAVDKKGGRIGYGKGYYDEMLSNMAPSVLKIGLNLTSAFDEFPFMEPHDHQIDYCITPFEIIDCNHV